MLVSISSKFGFKAVAYFGFVCFNYVWEIRSLAGSILIFNIITVNK